MPGARLCTFDPAGRAHSHHLVTYAMSLAPVMPSSLCHHLSPTCNSISQPAPCGPGPGRPGRCGAGRSGRHGALAGIWRVAHRQRPQDHRNLQPHVRQMPSHRPTLVQAAVQSVSSSVIAMHRRVGCLSLYMAALCMLQAALSLTRMIAYMTISVCSMRHSARQTSSVVCADPCPACRRIQWTPCSASPALGAVAHLLSLWAAAAAAARSRSGR